MSDAPVRDIGTVTDVYGFTVRVGVDHDTVTIGGAAYAMLGAGQQESFAQLYVAACHAAKAYAEANAEAAGEVSADG